MAAGQPTDLLGEDNLQASRGQAQETPGRQADRTFQPPAAASSSRR